MLLRNRAVGEFDYDGNQDGKLESHIQLESGENRIFRGSKHDWQC
jgi:hypothetical protein